MKIVVDISQFFLTKVIVSGIEIFIPQEKQEHPPNQYNLKVHKEMC